MNDKNRSQRTLVHIIVGSLPPMVCGVGEYSKQLIKHLANFQELSIQVITRVGSENPNPQVGMELVSNWSAKEFFRIASRIQRNSLVVVQYPSMAYLRSPWVALLVALLRLQRRSVVVMLHEYSASPRIGRALILATASPASRVVVSNRRDQRRLPRWVRGKTSVIPIGSNVEVNAERPERRILSTDRIWVANMGLLIPSKRLEIILEVAGRDWQDVGFVFMGRVVDDLKYSSDIAYRLHALAESSPEKVIFLSDGDNKEVSEILTQATIFVNAEKTPLTVKSGTTLAGCLHGLIPIGTAALNPSDNDPYCHGKNAILLDDMTPDSLSRAIVELARNSAKRDELRLESLLLASSFSWESIAKKYFELFQSLS
jgi:glycosyltransferase involved in cell wall biosynthesis